MPEQILSWISHHGYPGIRLLLVLGGAVAAGWLLQLIVLYWLRRLAKHTQTIADDALIRHCSGPLRITAMLAAVWLALPLTAAGVAIRGVVQHLLAIGLIVAVSWLIYRSTHVVEAVLLERHDLKAEDNLEARKLYTQLRVLKRVVAFVVSVIAAASILMTFDRMRQLGTSILASAGLAGIVLGIAAQRSIANLIAGVQIAFSQPIRLDDVVVVEGHWGRIEEITFTYVVVRIWDLRRLILPVSYFLEKPFENWTRVTAELLGTVYLQLDYSVPIDELRQQLDRIVEGNELWDGKVCKIQVTNTTDRTIEVRAMVSASDASRAFELRCIVREKLVDWVHREYPGALPLTRATLHSDDGVPEKERASVQ